MAMRLLTLIIIIVVTSISAWVAGVRMRRRIKRALGKKVQGEVELTSLNTWMKVKDAEQGNRRRQRYL